MRVIGLDISDQQKNESKMANETTKVHCAGEFLQACLQRKSAGWFSFHKKGVQ